MRYLLIIIILFTSCRVRKSNTELSKSETKVKTEQSSKVVSKTEISETDKSVEKDSVSDKSETFETDSSTVTADKLVFENGKLKEATGNAKVVNKVNTRKSNNIQSTGLKQADKVTNTTFDKDSVGDFSSDSTNKTKDKVKQTETKNLSWVLIPIIAIVLIGLFIRWKLSK